MKTNILLVLAVALLVVPFSPAFAAKPVPASLTIVSPNGGEVYTVGDTVKITWKSTGTISTVRLMYLEDPNHGDWIAFSAPNTGSYLWKVAVGNTAKTQFIVEISGYDAKNNYVKDQSNGYFTVNQKPSPTPTPTSTPSATPTPTPWPSPSKTPTPTPTPSPTPTPTLTPVPTPSPAPTLSFTVDSSVVASGTSTILRWNSPDATSCTAYGAWSGPQATSGEFNTGALSSDRYYGLYCNKPNSYTISRWLTINVFGQLNLRPNTWTLQQAVDSGVNLNCVSPFVEAGKGPSYQHRYYFSGGKLRQQDEVLVSGGVFVADAYNGIFNPGVVLYETYTPTRPMTAYYPGSLNYNYFANNMNTVTLTGYTCNEESIDPNLFVPNL